MSDRRIYTYLIRYDRIWYDMFKSPFLLCILMSFALCLLLLSEVINKKLHFFALACCFKLKPFNDDMMMMFSPFVDFSQQGNIMCYDRTLTHYLEEAGNLGCNRSILISSKYTFVVCCCCCCLPHWNRCLFFYIYLYSDFQLTVNGTVKYI